MKLRVYRSVWGTVDATDGDRAKSPHKTLDTLLPCLRDLGYDGIEIPLKFILSFGKEAFSRLIAATGLRVIVMVFSDGPAAPGEPGAFGGPHPGFTRPTMPGETDARKLVQTHLQVFKEQVEAAQEFAPTLVNSHSCKDSFTAQMAAEFFSEALAWQQQRGFRVLHETHRKRFLYSPWITRDFAPSLPDLEMVADLSHWINVAETNTGDPDLTRVIEALAPRFGHVHCRVGYDHGPQVPDPRVAEWMPYVEGHESWWDVVWKTAAAAGAEEVTMTPEHGPPTYQVCAPGTGEPLADVWDVNHWVALRRQERFAQMFGRDNTSRLVESDTQGLQPFKRAAK